MGKHFNSNTEQISLRSKDNADVVVGYASVFNSRSNLIAENGKVFIEIIREGAFDFALQRKDLNVLGVLNHDRKQMLARTKSGTLSLSVDSRGLKYSFNLPNTTLGRDVREMLDRGDIDSSSFKYSVRPKDVKWSRDEDGTLIREITKVERLFDVSLVIDPAFNAANVGLSEREYNEISKILDDEAKAEKEAKSRELNEYFDSIKSAFYS